MIVLLMWHRESLVGRRFRRFGVSVRWSSSVGVDLSRLDTAPGARLSHLPFESDGAFPAQCRVSATWIVEPVDVFEDRHLGLPPCFPRMSPDQFCFDGFEEGLESRISIAIILATHRHAESVLAQHLLIVVRTGLGSAIRVVNAARRRRTERNRLPGSGWPTSKPISFSSSIRGPPKLRRLRRDCSVIYTNVTISYRCLRLAGLLRKARTAGHRRRSGD